MSANAATKLSVPASHVVHGSTQDLPEDHWLPFEWEEPRLGRQVYGEIAVVRPSGTSGTLMAGFWRWSPHAAGVDGSTSAIYSAPLGDEMAVVLDGCATLTVRETGESRRVLPGSIICSPKNVEVVWEFDGPFFKKFWCIFDGSHPNADAPKDLLVANVSDNPPVWEPYRFTEPKEGPLVAGELVVLRPKGATSTAMCGLWRSGKGIPGSDVDASGAMVTPYTATLGDETCLLLEGEVEIVETLTGKTHSFRAGDVIGMSSGMHITWTSKGPFSKKFWVITKDRRPD